MKAFFSHPAVAVLFLLVMPVGLYHWVQHDFHSRDASLHEAVSLEYGAPHSAAAASLPATEATNAPGVHPEEFHVGRVAGVRPDDPVIGVIVGGQARAYLILAMENLDECVVNDTIRGTPISIVHDMTESHVRVLTARRREPSSEPLSVDIVGRQEGRLLIDYRGQTYYYRDRVLPLVDYPFAQCSWAVWRHAYPHTELYTGDLPLGAE